MDTLTDFLTRNIIAVFFFYGLAFFSMGLAVALESGRTSELRFARAMWLLSAFGLIHGSHEWFEMSLKISGQPPSTPIEVLRLAMLAASFLCLAGFGVWLLRPEYRPVRDVLVWTGLLLLIFLLGTVAIRLLLAPSLHEWLRATDAWCRYSLGIPGAALAAWALIVQRRPFLEQGLPRFSRDVTGAALALAWYGVVGQAFVSRSVLFPSTIINSDLFLRIFGVPVQLFRAIMATIVAVSMIRALRIFELETRRRLEAAREAERRSREETEQLYRELQYAARDLSVLFETSRIMVSTLDLSTLLDEAITRIVRILEPIQAGTILLYDASGTLSVFTSHGYDEPAAEARLRRCRLVGTRVAQTHKAVLSSESGQFREVTLANALAPAVGHPSAGLVQGELADVVGMPLVSKSGIIGSLVLEQHREATRFTTSDIPFIEALARQLGVAIENVRLYEERQRREALRGQLLRRAISAQEEERQRIARELHDETGQALTALAVGLGGVEETLDRNPALARQHVAQLKELSMRSLNELRQLVADLRPSLLDDLGLVPALRSYAKHYQENLPTEVSVEVSGDRRRLPPDIETVLFRIAQEALSNIARHARADHAVIRLEYGPSEASLTAQDDGRGFDPDQVLGPQAMRRAWGLVGIQERVMLAGGRFDLKSQPGAGTTLTVHIPIVGEEVYE